MQICLRKRVLTSGHLLPLESCWWLLKIATWWKKKTVIVRGRGARAARASLESWCRIITPERTQGAGWKCAVWDEWAQRVPCTPGTRVSIRSTTTLTWPLLLKNSSRDSMRWMRLFVLSGTLYFHPFLSLSFLLSLLFFTPTFKFDVQVQCIAIWSWQHNIAFIVFLESCLYVLTLLLKIPSGVLE